MRLKTLPIALFVFLAPSAMGQRFSLAAGGGAGPAPGNAQTQPNGQSAQKETNGTLLLDAGFEVFRIGSTSISVDVPVTLYGSRSSDVYASGLYSGFYTERITAAVTPGVRARFATQRRLSPWLSFGAGAASIHRTGVDFQSGQQIAAQTDSNLVAMLAPGAGADLRLNSRWFVRGEVRNYLFRTPATGFVSSFPYWNRWNHHLLVAAGVGFRFH
ncbi:MAG: hypothetical protein QM757_19320 [Paludibaculum sp.]